MTVGAVAAAVALLASGDASAEQRSVAVTILHVSDLRAQLEPHPELGPDGGLAVVGGFARLRTVLDRERTSAGGAVFTVEGGDAFHGSGPAAWSRGEAVVAPLCALGFDVGVPGDADLAWGMERYAELAARSGYPRVGLESAGASSRSLTLRRVGATVTFVGVSSRPDVAALRAEVAERRRRERPDLVVAVVHAGVAASRELARRVPGLDVVLAGHTGEPTADPVFEGRTIIVQPAASGASVARVDLTASGGRVALRGFRLVPVNDRVREHRAVKASVARALSPWRERMRRVVGHTATPIVRDDALENSADNLVADAVREVAGVQIALARPQRSSVAIPPGPITEGQLWDLVPTDARIRKGWATGRQLRDRLEREASSAFEADAWATGVASPPSTAGLEVTLTAAPPPGQRRVWSVHHAGRPLRIYDGYTVAVVEREDEPAGSLWGGADGQDVERLPLTVHDALLRFLARSGVVRPRREQRVAATDVVHVARRDGPARQGFGADSFQRRSSSW